MKISLMPNRIGLKPIYISFNLFIIFLATGLFYLYSFPINAQSTQISEKLHKIADSVSSAVPEGFIIKGKPRYFGTVEKKLENGTIFDYIDGAGENHIRHGFAGVCHITFENPDGDRIIADIYDMSSAANASSAFEDENICPPDSILLNIGEKQTKTYSYPPDYMIYFFEKNYLVHLSLENDIYKQNIEAMAVQIINIIKED